MSPAPGDPSRGLLALAALLASGLSLLLGIAAPSQSSQPASGAGAQACLECHESEKIMGIRETAHANSEDPNSPASRDQCESCHGPSATHMQFPMQVGNIRFTKHGKTSIAERNAACLSCHEDGSREHWDRGAHGAEIHCGDCHKVHQPQDPALVEADQAARCSSCHDTILSSAPASAPHRLEGKDALYCTQCHNPHGETSLAACTECHSQDAATLAKQTPKARDYHARAAARRIDCTACHKGFVHAMPEITLAPLGEGG